MPRNVGRASQRPRPPSSGAADAAAKQRAQQLVQVMHGGKAQGSVAPQPAAGAVLAGGRHAGEAAKQAHRCVGDGAVGLA